MAEMTHAHRMALAEETNARRDQSERESGFGADSDQPTLSRLITAALAIDAGLRVEDWSCVAEGLAILGAVIGFRPWATA